MRSGLIYWEMKSYASPWVLHIKYNQDYTCVGIAEQDNVGDSSANMSDRNAHENELYGGARADHLVMQSSSWSLSRIYVMEERLA